MIKETLEQTLSNEEIKDTYIPAMREYRKTSIYHQIKSLGDTWQYKSNVISEKACQGFAKGKVLEDRKFKSEVGYRTKYFKQRYWDGD